jgi:hypothetical protein
MTALDRSTLKTPPAHGAVLFVPEPRAMAAAAKANHRALARADIPLLDTTLAACRAQTRRALFGTDDALVIATGHQPGFIHTGVWAKHVAAMRTAAALDGIAVNLIVDADVPRSTSFAVPAVTGQGVTLGSVQYARSPAGRAYEDMERSTLEDIARFEHAVEAIMGPRYRASQMPTFFRGMRAASTTAWDWVDQVVAGRRAVEADLGVRIDDRRISRVGFGRLWTDLILRARPFAAAYNQALHDYRREHRLRGLQRPMPDLLVAEDRCETAFWAHRRGERRQRLFVSCREGDIHLAAGNAKIGRLSAKALAASKEPSTALQIVEGWHIRPRALTLMLWARLLLADLFIHGIGGAKYDQITDSIIARYYAIDPPSMGCVSATLHLGLPTNSVTPETVRHRAAQLRDASHNPQRHVRPGPRTRPWLERRGEAVQQALELRQRTPHDRVARRNAYDEIRRLNSLLLAEEPEARNRLERRFAEETRLLAQRRIAESREYFFGLFDRNRLDILMTALPAEAAFRV